MTSIIGSGLSGLCAAYFNKNKSEIFEKNNFTGGRIQSKEFSKNFVEGGAQFYSKEDPNIYGLIKKLNLEKEEVIVSLSKFYANRNSEFVSINNGTSTQLSDEEKVQIKLFYKKILETLPLVETFPEELIKKPFEKWYLENIGKESKWIIDGMMQAITFTSPKNQSALYGIIVCGTFFSDCYSLNGGLKKINEKLINISKPKIKLNQKIDFINFNEDKVKTISINKKTMPIKNNLISSIPSIELSKIIETSELSKKLKKITYNGCATLIIETDKKLLNNDSGILYTNKNEKISVLIDESNYYNFKNKKNVLGFLFPYKNRPNEKEMITLALKKVSELTNINFKINKKEIYYWDYGLPEFNYKTYKLQQEINEISNSYSNFAICGDFMGLPSLDACVESAKNAVQKINKSKK